MKNMFKKALATLAALAIMLSVVMPCAAGNGPGNGVDTAPDLWDDDIETNRD